ncbi:MAG: V-type ATP synthase subunit I, partial [Clostridiales bacterium]|nr:V-type ATP synthase subunit I [Clostridiales bacterium]
MAVLQMQHISIFALKKDRKQILELLQRLGVIEIKDGKNEDVLFQKNDLSNSKSIFEKNVSITKNALEILDIYAKEEKPFLSGLNGRTIVTADVYDTFHGKYEEVLKMSKDICGYEKIITECKT